MEIKLTDEQVEHLVEKTIRDYVLNKMNKKINQALNDKYHFQQSVSGEMKKAVVEIMEKKIDESMNNRDLASFIDVDKVSASISDRILLRVSESISEAIRETFY